jgi:trans-aconitate 2-methyltransferase
VERALRDLGHDPFASKVFATPAQTRERLERAGFTDVEVWLHEEPTRIESGEPLETYLSTVILGALLDTMPAADRAPFVHEVAERMPEPVLDYVRLNIRASRSG